MSRDLTVLFYTNLPASSGFTRVGNRPWGRITRAIGRNLILPSGPFCDWGSGSCPVGRSLIFCGRWSRLRRWR